MKKSKTPNIFYAKEFMWAPADCGGIVLATHFGCNRENHVMVLRREEMDKLRNVLDRALAGGGRKPAVLKPISRSERARLAASCTREYIRAWKQEGKVFNGKITCDKNGELWLRFPGKKPYSATRAVP